MKETICFCMVGLPLFGKEGSGTPVFKILVRALLNTLEEIAQNDTFAHTVTTHIEVVHNRSIEFSDCSQLCNYTPH